MLSKMASIIGGPLFTNRMTTESGRFAYARVCVEIKIRSVLPDEVML